MTMSEFQRGEAIELLERLTIMRAEEIEEYEDYELEAWIDELGYEWREGTGYGLGAWVEVQT